MALQRILWLLTISHIALALSSHTSGNYPLAVVGEFPLPHTFENIAARHNGQLLLTSIVSSALYQVSPFEENHIERIVDIPRTTGLLGIVELEKDVFYVAGANVSSTSAAPGSNAVWKVDLRDQHRSTGLNETARANPTPVLVANITDARLLNGMCRLNNDDVSTVLIADSGAGKIFKLDVHSGSFEVVIEGETLENTPTGLQVAVNGIHVQRSHLYFTNLNRGIFGRIQISGTTGIAQGPVDVIVQDLAGDDFLVAPDGEKAWVAMNGQSALVEVDIPRRRARAVVHSSYLASASAVALGRTLLDRDSLYVSSAAVLDVPVPSNTTTTGGVVIRVDLPHI